jgi:hypothetical protein
MRHVKGQSPNGIFVIVFKIPIMERETFLGRISSKLLINYAIGLCLDALDPLIIPNKFSVFIWYFTSDIVMYLCFL